MAPLSVTSVAVILFKWSTTLIGQWRFAAFTVAAMAAANVECESVCWCRLSRGVKGDRFRVGDAFCCQNTQSMRLREMLEEVERQHSRFVQTLVF